MSALYFEKKNFWVWQPTWCEQKKISKKWFVQNMLLVPKNISAKSENVTIILWGDIFVKRLLAFFSFFPLIIHIISDVINFFGKKIFFLTSFIEIQLCAKAFWKIPIFWKKNCPLPGLHLKQNTTLEILKNELNKIRLWTSLATR